MSRLERLESLLILAFLNSDELTSVAPRSYSRIKGSSGIFNFLRGNQVWSDLERLQSECDAIIAEQDASGVEAPLDAKSHSDLLYAASIAELCESLLKLKQSPDEVIFAAAIREAIVLGQRLEEWDWRGDYVPDILDKRRHDKENQANAPKGGKVISDRVGLARAVLKQLAFEPQTLRRLLSRPKAAQVGQLCKLAQDYDRPREDSQKLFCRSPDKPYSKRWFADELARWQRTGELQKAINILLDK